jgi:signal transduction histidine kinase
MADVGREEPAVPPRGLLAGRVVVRLTLTTCVLIVAACVVLSVVLVRRHLEDIRRGLVDRGRAISEFVARDAELGVLSGDVASLEQIATVARSHPDVLYCRFFDRDGALLVSSGDAPPASAAAPPPAGHADAAPVPVGIDAWEFREDVTTTAVRPSREELLAGGGEGGTQERIGTVAIGLALGQLHARRRLAFVTAVGFTLLVALLAVASAALLLHGTLRALASSAALAEERSRLAELKANFVTQASHEFRTPLAVILACCSVLQRYGARMDPDQRSRRLTKIQGSVRHMTELLEDVLTLGRAESGKLECVRRPVDVAALCQEVVADVQATAADSHRLVFDGAGCSGDVMLDAKLVRLVLRNLLANGVKYSPDGGTVRLEATHRDGVLTLRVADRGIGIPAEDAAALFEPFHRGANVGAIPGSGLGLAITRKAVVAHGGAIAVEGAPGGGTVFTVTLPDAEAARPSLAS